MGIMIQTIALAAQAYDLGTCIMRAIVDYPEQIREIVGVPESKRIIVGVAIGYPDEDHPVNKVWTGREDAEKLITWVE
jgi:nitroreductase